MYTFFRYNVRYVALKIAYLGWDYHGFASQENIENTIEVPKPGPEHLWCPSTNSLSYTQMIFNFQGTSL